MAKHSSNASSSANSGIGFVGLLTILFIALKLTHFIDWPWVWVLSPVWIAGGLTILVVALFLAIATITFWLKE